MFEYPQNFNIPSYKKGEFVATSRFFSIGIFILFFIIGCLSFFIIWTKKSQYLNPFIIMIDENSNKWETVGILKKSKRTADYNIKEALIINFFTNMFENKDEIGISDEECITKFSILNKTYPLSCMTNENTFSEYITKILPFIKKYNINKIIINNIYQIHESTPYKWFINFSLFINNKEINVKGFVSLSNNQKLPATLGYKISEFYLYKG